MDLQRRMLTICNNFLAMGLILLCHVLPPSLSLESCFAVRDEDFRSYVETGLNSKQVAEGWLSLLDASTMNGWRTGGTGWIIKDGAMNGSGVDELVRTAVQFDDFEMSLEYRSDSESDFELLIRTSPNPRNLVEDCCIVKIRNDAALLKESAWCSMRLVAQGSLIRVWRNGRNLPDVFDTKLKKGYIGLRSKGSGIQIRKLFVRPLGLVPLFTGRDLAGWNMDQTLDSRFAVEDGVMSVSGGRGQIETEGQFGDFVFSMHARTNAVGLNSGIFFRCIPGELMNGYESQIHNQFKENLRSRPVDCGTGGIFRRSNARLVNADDKAWFAKTIVVDGATICVWVNGLLVTDWTDTRKSDSNPRRGKRLGAGTIIIQGHDPTTDLSFQNLSARELKPRRSK